MTEGQKVEFFASRHAEAIAVARVWNEVSLRVITPESFEFIKAFVVYTLGYFGKNFEDLTPTEQQACMDYQFDVASGTAPAPETLAIVKEVYPLLYVA
jgi:hypothetical protein